jgi:hypothetical protein
MVRFDIQDWPIKLSFNVLLVGPVVREDSKEVSSFQLVRGLFFLIVPSIWFVYIYTSPWESVDQWQEKEVERSIKYILPLKFQRMNCMDSMFSPASSGQDQPQVNYSITPTSIGWKLDLGREQEPIMDLRFDCPAALNFPQTLKPSNPQISPSLSSYHSFPWFPWWFGLWHVGGRTRPQRA